MFSIFPSLLTFKFFAPTILRLALGIIFAQDGWNKIKSKGENIDEKLATVIRLLGWIELIIALLFSTGFLTQLAALSVIVITIYFSYLKRKGINPDGHSLAFNILVIAASLSLLISGAGAIAVDLPL